MLFHSNAYIPTFSVPAWTAKLFFRMETQLSGSGDTYLLNFALLFIKNTPYVSE